MNEGSRLSALIGDIYDAALDPSLWPEVLGGVTRYVVGSATGLFWKDAASQSGNVYFHDDGLDPHYRQVYFEKYVRLDPLNHAHVFAEIGEPVSTTDLVSYDEFRQSRIYKEWVQPQKLVDFVSVVLEKSATRAAMLGVFRHERHGMVDEETRQRMRAIAPHVRRAVLVGRVIDFKTAETGMFAELLDGLRAGMFLVDARGRILHANFAGQELLDDGGIVRGRDGRLVAANPDADRALRDIFRSAGEGDEAIGVKGIALPLHVGEGERHIAHVLPLTSAARRRAAGAFAAVAAIFIHRATIDSPSPTETVARHYNLTPTELRVLLGIVEVGGVPDVADSLGIAQTTVKWHLGRLYQKMGVARQADLVKLLAGFASPLLA